MTDINWLINEYNNSITNKTIRHYSTTISTYYFFSGLSIYKCGWLRCEFYNNNNILQTVDTMIIDQTNEATLAVNLLSELKYIKDRYILVQLYIIKPSVCSPLNKTINLK